MVQQHDCAGLKLVGLLPVLLAFGKTLKTSVHKHVIFVHMMLMTICTADCLAHLCTTHELLP